MGTWFLISLAPRLVAKAVKRAEDEEMEEAATSAGLTVEQYQLAVQRQQAEFEAKKKAKIAGANADLGTHAPSAAHIPRQQTLSGRGHR